MSVQLKWNRPIKQIVGDALGGDKTLLFMAQTYARLYNPFVPMDTGMLATGAVQYGVDNGAGFIRHTSPYAHRQYNGDGFNFSQERHPLASAHWDEAAKQAGKGKVLAADIQAYIRSGKHG